MKQKIFLAILHEQTKSKICSFPIFVLTLSRDIEIFSYKMCTFLNLRHRKLTRRSVRFFFNFIIFFSKYSVIGDKNTIFPHKISDYSHLHRFYTTKLVEKNVLKKNWKIFQIYTFFPIHFHLKFSNVI